MEKRKYIAKIIAHYLHGRYNPETEAKVQRWLIDPSDSNEKKRASSYTAGNMYSEYEYMKHVLVI
jgi:hypothetical protein